MASRPLRRRCARPRGSRRKAGRGACEGGGSREALRSIVTRTLGALAASTIVFHRPGRARSAGAVVRRSLEDVAKPSPCRGRSRRGIPACWTAPTCVLAAGAAPKFGRPRGSSARRVLGGFRGNPAISATRVPGPVGSGRPAGLVALVGEDQGASRWRSIR